MDKAKWKSIMLPRSVVEQLEIFADSKLSNSLGYTNKSQIAALAIRDFIRKTNWQTAYIDFIDSDKDIVKLMDYKLGKTVEIKINDMNSQLTCNHHNSHNCDHIEFVSGLPRFEEILSKINFKMTIPKIKTEFSVEEIIEELKKAIDLPIDEQRGKRPKKQRIQILKKMIQHIEKEK